MERRPPDPMPPALASAWRDRSLHGSATLVALGAAAAVVAVALLIMAADWLHVARQPVFRPTERLSAAEEASLPGPSASSYAPPASARLVAPDVVAPPDIRPRELERVAARAPLGALGLASSGRGWRQDDWLGTLLYRPVVTSSASFEAMGHAIIIAGTEPVDAESPCEFEGVRWRCGERALLAFRYWLRGRALRCQVPPVAERWPVAAPCRLGKQDVGAWLVSNGWALARPGGGYEKAELVAREARMGVFGSPE